ncbi:MAG: 3-alpha,7-alpha,12-alpha-trihydroxy-5-beta-cholest-24-enoyl-CoA hydratase [Rhodospirillaceae bacterium]|nr:3-alpha,7-alpha,12-alpha-trihydroxy-5-beta-cholest-24-enoyl-CoA hydratase [Rhodospirillaceae bacterium]|tara:strand:+ start:9823 stop:10689 length:867 start_codon:yes stop_codon:yes gene_type:complete
MIRPNPSKVAAYSPPSHRRSYTERDVQLYALGLGLGSDPVARDELPFVYEEWGPKVLPTMASVLGSDMLWFADPDLGLGDAAGVHGDELLTLHQPLPPNGTISSRISRVDLYDRGESGHGVMILEEEMHDEATGILLATRRQTDVLIGAGGFGGDAPPPTYRPALPDREPDVVVERTTLTQGALLYRLSGDHYHLHVEDDFAREAGFDGPILHGLATYGLACHAIVAACCGHDPVGLTSFFGRFTAPVYPGESLATDIWRGEDAVSFRVRAVQRGATVIDNGHADLRG